MLHRARFIWISSQRIDHAVSFRTLLRDGPGCRDDGVNRWVLLRRHFVLPAAASAAAIDITVDGRYQLFVNGRPAGRGPGRTSPAFQRYDTHDLAPQLQPGGNVIAVLVHVYGIDMAWYERSRDYWQSVFGDGGLWCDARIDCGSALISVQSDESWKWFDCDAWRRDTPRSGWGQDFIEDHDARRMPRDWTSPDFDDSVWQNCQLLLTRPDENDRARGWGPIEPFPTLLPRTIPALAETPLAPVRIVGLHGVRPDPGLPVDRRIYEETLVDLPAGLVADPEALLADDQRFTTIVTRGDCEVAMLLAFEQRHTGYPFIEIEACGGEVIELAVAETIPGEYGPPPPGLRRIVRESFLDCAHVFRYTARPGWQRFQKFEWTAVKYAQLVVRNASRGIRIRHVGSTYTHYPVQFRGEFRCSDRFLDQLWEVGRYTLLQCTHDGWSDGPGREKRQWLGDGLVHYLAAAAAFGPSTQAVDRQYLVHAAESQRSDGLLEMFAPGDHHHGGVIIPDFNLHWICAAEHYLLHSGDLDTVAEVFPALQRSLSWFERQLGPNDLLVDVPYWHFIEWADIGREGEAAVINAMLVGALRAAAAIAGHLGYGRAAGRYLDLAARVGHALNERHWDESRGIYVDVVNPRTGTRQPRVSQHANAAMILWRIAPPERWPRMLEYVMAPGRLRLTAVPPIVPTGEPFDPAGDVVRANTFFAHFVYQALATAGRFELALEAMRAAYGPMLETGTETLWESLAPAASLCHAFSASPVYQLSAHVLGVTPLEPGFRRFQVAPQPSGLASAAGRYPTPAGDILVSWKLAGANVELELTVPAGTSGSVCGTAGLVTTTPARDLPPGHHRVRLVSTAA